MKDIDFQIENFKTTEDRFDVDIICVEALEHLNEIISKSIVTISDKQQNPPTEAIEFDDRIEYNSPIYGRQILKIK